MTVVEEALDAAVADRNQYVALVGPSGAGKSKAAGDVASTAQARGLRPVRVAPPSGAVDAGAAAVASVVSQLNGRLQPSQGWRGALETAEKCLGGDPNIVVICDEPARWDRGGEHFASRAREAAELLTGAAAHWPTVGLERAGVAASNVFYLARAGVAELLDGERWGDFADPAKRVASRDLAPAFTTPLAQRLAVAIDAWAPDAVLPSTTGDLAETLADLLARSRRGRHLWVYWQRLALARIELPAHIRTELGDGRLDAFARETASLVFFDGNGRLHDELRRVAEERPLDPALGEATAAEVHRLLFTYHEARTRELSEARSPGASRHAAEAQYHAAELGDSERLDLISFELSDQLNALGTRLSRRRGDHETAAQLFLRAVTANDQDAYSQHGRARSLDVLGHGPQETEERYRRALELEPDVPQWHADSITYLLSLGRVDDARLAWSTAESSAFDSQLDAGGFDVLHLRVATHLIALSELDFAAYVLDAVPAFAQDAEFRRLSELLAGRASAEDKGGFVPAPRSGRPWWQEPPQVLTARDSDGRTLTTWGAGRVASVDEGGARLHLAEVRSPKEDPVPVVATVSPDVWQKRCLDSVDFSELKPGRFVELGRYRGPKEDDAVTAIRLLPFARLPEPRHLPLPASRWRER